jgi:formylglycine-generating enzyme
VNRALAAVIGLAALGACQPRQWLVQVATDTSAPIWGDRVLVEVLDEEGNLACDGCQREFAVENASFPLTFGVSPTPGNANRVLRVRGRFYRAAQAPAGVPIGTELIDHIGVLPSLNDGGGLLGGSSRRVVLPLLSFCYNTPSDVQAHKTCRYVEQDSGAYRLTYDADEAELSNSALELLQPGYFYQRFVVHCSDRPAPAGMVCVEGEGFLLGSAESVGVDTDFPTQPSSTRQPRLSLFLDRDEVTVETVRKIATALKLGPKDLMTRGSAGVPDSCTYLGPHDASHDALPINCISRSAAAAVCRHLGKHLPDEGQWELAARNGARGTRYPWGEEAPTCERSIVGVMAACPRQGPLAGGAPADVTASGIRNLGGNLSEWVDGILVSYGDGCWTEFGQAPFYDGDCAYETNTVGWNGPWPHRGGAWDRRASSSVGFARFSSPDGGPSPSIGFRCAETVPTCADVCKDYSKCYRAAHPGHRGSGSCEQECQELLLASQDILRLCDYTYSLDEDCSAFVACEGVVSAD